MFTIKVAIRGKNICGRCEWDGRELYLQNARETYKDDDDLGAIFKDKQTLLNAITAAIGPSGKLSVQEWASIGKALGIYTDKI